MPALINKCDLVLTYPTNWVILERAGDLAYQEDEPLSDRPTLLNCRQAFRWRASTFRRGVRLLSKYRSRNPIIMMGITRSAQDTGQVHLMSSLVRLTSTLRPPCVCVISPTTISDLLPSGMNTSTFMKRISAISAASIVTLEGGRRRPYHADFEAQVTAERSCVIYTRRPISPCSSRNTLAVRSYLPRG